MTDYHVNNSDTLSVLSRKNLNYDRSLCIYVMAPLSYAIDYNEKGVAVLILRGFAEVPCSRCETWRMGGGRSGILRF
jgi:hypothetical protein